MICPNCNSENIQISTKQISAKSNARLISYFMKLGHCLLTFCTGGLWLLVVKNHSKNKTKFISHNVELCKNCGYKWSIR